MKRKVKSRRLTSRSKPRRMIRALPGRPMVGHGPLEPGIQVRALARQPDFILGLFIQSGPRPRPMQLLSFQDQIERLSVVCGSL